MPAVGGLPRSDARPARIQEERTDMKRMLQAGAMAVAAALALTPDLIGG